MSSQWWYCDNCINILIVEPNYILWLCFTSSTIFPVESINAIFFFVLNCFSFLWTYHYIFQLLQFFCPRFLNSSLEEVSLVVTFVGRRRAWGRPFGVLVIFYFTIWVLMTLLFILWHSLSWALKICVLFICMLYCNENILIYQIMKIYGENIENSRKWDSSV